MKVLRFIAMAGVIWGLTPSGDAAEITRQDIQIQTTPASYHAKVGDEIVFEVSLIRDGEVLRGQEMEYELSWDVTEPIRTGKFTAESEPLRLSVMADKPGFVRLWVFAPGTRANRDTRNESGVAIEPEKIVARQTMPEDFEEFWQAKRELVYSTPMYPHLTPVDSGIEGFETFDLQINCPGGLNCSGYYGRPKDAKPGSLPAVLFVHASGVYSSWLNAARTGHRLNAIVYDLNSHGIPNGREKEYYEQLAAGPLKGYGSFGREDREKCYFLGMFMRTMRAMQFLKSQPEWDGKTLIVYGGSQGGGTSTAAACLDPQVTLFVAEIPGMCDRVDPDWRGQSPPDEDSRRRILETSRYFDAVNFARKTNAGAIVTAGFVDSTCRPSCIYAMFNSLGNPNKSMLDMPNMGHGFQKDTSHITELLQRMMEHYLATGEVMPATLEQARAIAEEKKGE